MIDRMFNQEERQTLSRDKRLAIVDPGKNYFETNMTNTQIVVL